MTKKKYDGKKPIFPQIPHDEKKSIKLKFNDIKNIRILYNGGKTVLELAEMYKVSKPCIRYWINPKYRENQLKCSSERQKIRLKTDPIFKARQRKHSRIHVLNRKKTDWKYKLYTLKIERKRRAEMTKEEKLIKSFLYSNKNKKINNKRLKRAKTSYPFRAIFGNL